MNQPIVEDLVTGSYILANEGVLDGLGHISGSGKRSDGWSGRRFARLSGARGSREAGRCFVHCAALWEVGLQELARFLQVKELSTASHAVRQAEERLKEDSGFRRQADQILKRLDSSMQPDPFGPYALRRAGASSGGVISNALAVQHVIENEPTRATRATSSSVLKVASADA